jgi:hypothetical protein
VRYFRPVLSRDILPICFFGPGIRFWVGGSGVRQEGRGQAVLHGVAVSAFRRHVDLVEAEGVDAGAFPRAQGVGQPASSREKAGGPTGKGPLSIADPCNRSLSLRVSRVRRPGQPPQDVGCCGSSRWHPVYRLGPVSPGFQREEHRKSSGKRGTER